MFVLKLYINSSTQRIELNFDFLSYSEDINIKEEDAEHAGTGVRTRRLFGIDPVFGPAELDKLNFVFSMFNKAAEKCNLTNSSFYRP